MSLGANNNNRNKNRKNQIRIGKRQLAEIERRISKKVTATATTTRTQAIESRMATPFVMPTMAYAPFLQAPPPPPTGQ